MESVDNSQFNPPNYFSREDQRAREHQRGYSKVCLRRVCFRCEPLSREISTIFFFFFLLFLPLGIPRIPPRFANFSPSTMSPRRVREDIYTVERLSSETIVAASIVRYFGLQNLPNVEFCSRSLLKVVKYDELRN